MDKVHINCEWFLCTFLVYLRGGVYDKYYRAAGMVCFGSLVLC